MIVKLLTEHHLEFLSLKGGCRRSSESTHVKMPHCWKSHTLAQVLKPHLISSNILAVTCDLQQCGILTSVDSYEPVQSLLNLETPNGVQSVALCS